MRELPIALFIMGPTASGKTELALQLADQLPVEIISVDSALVYRGMDIGTAKPEPSILARFPHRLVDICDPEDSYSAARFREDALQAMGKAVQAGRIPLLVGGTMLYFRALQQGLSALPQADAGVRNRLKQRLESEGLAALHQQLAECDPISAQRIHARDTQRILRALEVHELTGQPLSRQQTLDADYRLPYRLIKLVRAPADRGLLHRRIEQRFYHMLELGFEQEVRQLLARPAIHPELPSMRAVGYRQMIAWIHGQYSYQQMIEKAVIATRQLAKRQFTWLRREPDTHWLDDEHDVLKQASKLIEQRLG